MEGVHQQETAVDRLNCSEILPIARIKEVFGEPIDDREIKPTNKDRFDNECQRISSIYQILRLMEQGLITIAQARKYIPPNMQLPGYYKVMLAYSDAGLELPAYSQATFTGVSIGKEVYNLHLAHFSDEELHFGDITLQNTKVHLPISEQRRLRTPNPGLGNGIFDETLQNLFRFAKENGYKRISLSAVDWIRVSTFMKREFNLRPGPLLDAGRISGISLPMVMEL